MNLENALNTLVVLLVVFLIFATLSVSEDPIDSAYEERRLEYECCPNGTDLSVHANDVLDCIYGGEHSFEMSQGSVPFAVKVYCNTGEVLEY